MNIARTAVGSASLDGVLYAVGGECALADTQDDTLYLHCVELYDPVRKRWESKPNMKLARSFVAVASVGGHLYAIGNFHLSSLVSSNHLFQLVSLLDAENFQTSIFTPDLKCCSRLGPLFWSIIYMDHELTYVYNVKVKTVNM